MALNAVARVRQPAKARRGGGLPAERAISPNGSRHGRRSTAGWRPVPSVHPARGDPHLHRRLQVPGRADRAPARRWVGDRAQSLKTERSGWQ
jgi:hypothetical protein